MAVLNHSYTLKTKIISRDDWIPQAALASEIILFENEIEATLAPARKYLPPGMLVVYTTGTSWSGVNRVNSNISGHSWSQREISLQ